MKTTKTLKLSTFFGFTLVSFSCLTTGCSDRTKEFSAIQTKNLMAVVTVNDLHAAFTANGIAADTKYNNQVLVVNGIVNDVGSSGGGDIPWIVLRNSAGSKGFAVSCEFRKEDGNKLAAIKKGQKVSIKGQCFSGNEDNVGMTYCAFVDQAP